MADHLHLLHPVDLPVGLVVPLALAFLPLVSVLDLEQWLTGAALAALPALAVDLENSLRRTLDLS